MKPIDVPKSLDEIERRAKRCGVTIADLLAAGDIHRETWKRWREGTSMPNVGSLNRIIVTLEAAEGKRT
jgi:predicted transcriptional regulator